MLLLSLASCELISGLFAPDHIGTWEHTTGYAWGSTSMVFTFGTDGTHEMVDFSPV